MQANQVVIGIDLGGTFTKIGVINRTGDMLALERFSSHANEPFEVFLNHLSAIYQQIKKELDKTFSIIAVGVGTPNANCFTGEMENPPNFKWGKAVPIVTALKKIFNVPVFLNNDANIAAIGEMVFGGAQGMKHLAVITLGTGLGSGFIINGKLHIGQDGMAGEIGHTIAIREGRACRCGLRGCLEQYVSVTGIRKTVKKLLSQNEDTKSLLGGQSFDNLTGKEVSEAAEQEDPIALEAFELTGKLLGQSLADVTAFFNPKAIFLTGGLAKAKKFLLAPTKRHLEQNLLNVYQGRVQLLISDLVDKEGAVLGAAALAWEEIKSR